MDHYPPSTPILENCPPGSDSMQRLVAHWERGYRCHGLWKGNQRLARVSLGHPSFWKAGRDAYSWETDVRPSAQGSAMTLKAAKKAAENSLTPSSGIAAGSEL